MWKMEISRWLPGVFFATGFLSNQIVWALTNREETGDATVWWMQVDWPSAPPAEPKVWALWAVWQGIKACGMGGLVQPDRTPQQILLQATARAICRPPAFLPPTPLLQPSEGCSLPTTNQQPTNHLIPTITTLAAVPVPVTDTLAELTVALITPTRACCAVFTGSLHSPCPNAVVHKACRPGQFEEQEGRI